MLWCTYRMAHRVHWLGLSHQRLFHSKCHPISTLSKQPVAFVLRHFIKYPRFASTALNSCYLGKKQIFMPTVPPPPFLPYLSPEYFLPPPRPPPPLRVGVPASGVVEPESRTEEKSFGNEFEIVCFRFHQAHTKWKNGLHKLKIDGQGNKQITASRMFAWMAKSTSFPLCFSNNSLGLCYMQLIFKVAWLIFDSRAFSRE